jgi:hypothetical protein
VDPEAGVSHGVQKAACAGQSSDKKIGGSYHPPLALNHRVTVKLYAWCVEFGKPAAIYHLVIQTNSQISNLAKHIVTFTVKVMALTVTNVFMLTELR